MTLPALIFDLDGTLVDSHADIHRALTTAFPEVSFTLAEVQSYVGNGVSTLISRATLARQLNPASHSARMEAFLADYNAAPAALTRPFPGVAGALQSLAAAGHRMALCTNKPVQPARAILEALGLAPYFPILVGGDSLPNLKPNPAPLLHAIAQCAAARALFIGDSEVDAETARAAQVPFILFTEGYRKSPVAALNPAASFSDYARLPALIAGL